MRQIRAAVFVSLDGVMQAPGGPEEDPRGGFSHGGWTFTYWDKDLGKLMEQAMGTDYDLLLGRRTYEIFAAYWPYVDDELSRTFNSINKYVAAGPDTPLDWRGSVRLEGDIVEAVRRLKSSQGRDLLIQGSSELIHALLTADLIDRLTVLVFPVMLGRGRRLFDEGTKPHAWTLTASRATSRGVVVSSYVRAGDVPTGSFPDGRPSEAELARRARWRAEA